MDKNLEDLLQTDRNFSLASVKEGTVEAYKKFLIEDATFLPNRRNAVNGLNNICEAIKIPGITYTMSWTPENGRVSSSGDLGYTWGNYELSFTNKDGNLESEKGKYLNVWSKQPDGSWKVVIDMGNLS